MITGCELCNGDDIYCPLCDGTGEIHTEELGEV
jgi:hypothetical protein